MARNQVTSPAPLSSSSFTHSTPALAHRHVGFDASSSSPPTDVIATPSDRHEGTFRGKNGKLQARRSTRIRTSSSTHFDSSPQVDLGGYGPESEQESSIVASGGPAAPSRQYTGAGQFAGREARTPRASVQPRAGPSQETLNALAQAQAHGITPDQFEEAKQQIMRYLRDEVANGAGAASRSHTAQIGPPPGSALQTATAHLRAPSHSPAQGSEPADPFETSHLVDSPYQATPARTPTASSSLQAAFDLDAPRTAVRPKARSAFDDVVGRSVKRPKREALGPSSGTGVQGMKSTAGSAVLQWAQEDSSSSSSDEDSNMLASVLSSRRGQGAASALSPALGAPSPATAPTSDTNASPSIPSQRGMMDRYMSTQSAHLAAAPEATVPQVDLQVPSEPAPLVPVGFKSPVASPASPPRNKKSQYPAHVLQSPSPSKPPASILFSPDVARLLRSELDELEANAISSRHSTSPSKLGEIRSDCLTDQASPSQHKSSPLAPADAARTREAVTTSQDKSSNKRARWSKVESYAEAGPTSPTPSSASFSMRAPSFCDSSPAVSERDSIAVRSIPLMASTAGVVAHPASAPDFLYGGPPSSSPTSSHHSEFVPQRFARSSPGPPAAPMRSNSFSAAAESVPSGRSKRTATRRDTAQASSVLLYQGKTTKPPYSYAALIGQALFSTPDLRMALSDVYTWIMEKYPYFRKEDSGWQNSIRHNLSLNQCFIKTQRGPNNPGKGCLWAIKPGTEDQFVDGDFVRKGGQGNTRRRGRGSPSSQQSRDDQVRPASQELSRELSTTALTDTAHDARQSSPASVSGRSVSPTPSALSGPTTVQPVQAAVVVHDYARPAYSPAPSSISARSMTPSVASPPARLSQLEPPVQITFSEPMQTIARPASAAAMSIHGGPLVPQVEEPTQLEPPAMLSRSHSSMGYLERNIITPFSTVNQDVKPTLAPPAQLSRTTSAPMVASRSAPSALEPPPASPPQRRLISHEPLLSTTMSPPTSVYQRLAGPYQPLAYGSTSLQSHRALALLSSPEAGGIMPGRTSPRRPRLLTTGGATTSPPSPATTFVTAGGASRKRQRTDSERDFGMLSPTALVHISSPVSSLRGGARGPASPEQLKATPLADPEKRSRRVTGSRLLPAVNALASSEFDPFRSPPPSSASSMSATVFGSAKYHLRSPSARLQAALSTPGGTKGRVPLGFSPSLASGASWERSTAPNHSATGPDDSTAAWNELYGGPVDTELEHFSRRGGMRSAWPSPGGNASHVSW